MTVAVRLASVLLLLAVRLPSVQGGETPRPNLLLILTDDQGYGDVGAYGNALAATPCIDALAAESVLFRNFHAQPVCAPTRAELMTGRRCQEVGVWGVHAGRDYLSLDQRTLANELSDAGYATAMMGKWHLGKTTAYLPYNRGFEESWSLTERLYEHTDPVFDHNGEREQVAGWTPDILTDLAIRFITRERKRPFFLYVAYPEVHEPWVAKHKLIAKHERRGLSRSLATVFAMNEQLDATVGRLLDSLRASGQDEETVVVFLGDNGPINATSNGLARLTSDEMALRNPERLRGMKGQLYENGTRVPGVIRWPGVYAPREVGVSADVVDLFPTLLEIAGVAPTTAARGQSLVPVLRGDADATLTRSVLYANHETLWPGRNRLYDHLASKQLIDPVRTHLAVRRGDDKLVQIEGRRELFDLAADPQETNDLSGSRPDLLQQLGEQLDRNFQEILQGRESYRAPVFPVGYHGESASYAHACAASEVFGQVETNSHSVDNWKGDGDGVALRLRVDTPGRYQVKLHAELGTVPADILARLGDTTLRQTLTPGGHVWLGECELQEGASRIALELSGVSTPEEAAIERLYGVVFERM